MTQSIESYTQYIFAAITIGICAHIVVVSINGIRRKGVDAGKLVWRTLFVILAFSFILPVGGHLKEGYSSIVAYLCLFLAVIGSFLDWQQRKRNGS